MAHLRYKLTAVQTGTDGGRLRSQMEQSPHILFVEDDPEIRSLVANLLRDSGFRASVAREGREMDRILEASRIDLLILDIMRPGEDGLSLCRRVRAHSNLPIIMLTARGSEIERVVGLEMGADDYLAKPFSTHELLVAFCEHPNRVLTRDQLVDLTRGRGSAPFDRSIDIQVSRLRRKIEADPKDPALIQTVRAGGYIFTPEVAPA
jgi:two-component system, OmpR family, response regulator